MKQLIVATLAALALSATTAFAWDSGNPCDSTSAVRATSETVLAGVPITVNPGANYNVVLESAPITVPSGKHLCIYNATLFVLGNGSPGDLVAGGATITVVPVDSSGADTRPYLSLASMGGPSDVTGVQGFNLSASDSDLMRIDAPYMCRHGAANRFRFSGGADIHNHAAAAHNVQQGVLSVYYSVN